MDSQKYAVIGEWFTDKSKIVICQELSFIHSKNIQWGLSVPGRPTSIIPLNHPPNWISCIINSFYWEGNRGSERLSKSPNITQLVSTELGSKFRAPLIPHLCLFYFISPSFLPFLSIFCFLRSSSQGTAHLNTEQNRLSLFLKGQRHGNLIETR